MKIAPLWKEFNRHSDQVNTVIVHTGQHYDVNMSDSFFRDLELPEPDIYLGAGSGTHADHIHRAGNIMIDSLISFEAKAREADTCDRLSLTPGSYGLITLHRPSNVDEKDSLSRIITTLNDVAQSFDVIFPVHPRTRQKDQTA
jgi:UDP-N-acetylglucosamine 2-epimerase (non-hydrolysing)